MKLNSDEVYCIVVGVSQIRLSLRSPPQVAISWLLHKPNVPSVVIGAKTMRQLEDNLGAASVRLTGEQMSRLDAASEAPLPYPYEQIRRLNQGRRREDDPV